LLNLLTIFSGSVRIEAVHPLQFGFVRRKVRTQRRYGMPIVHPLMFYPWRLFDFGRAFIRWLRLYLRYYRMLERIKKDRASPSYVDEALRLHTGADDPDKLVEAFADKIPQTHGAPLRVGSKFSAIENQRAAL
jgi:hypothetical protein